MGTAAGVPESQSSGAAGQTFDEIEAQLAEAERAIERPDLSKITVDDATLPENLRGKSVSDIIGYARGLEDVLRQSESARQQALQMAQLASEGRAQAAAAPPAPVEEPLITAEQIAEAFSEDPAKGVALIQKSNEQMIKRTAAQFQQRLEPMMAGTVSTLEADARRKYPDEFELYKDEIVQTLKEMPNANAIMSNPKSWDDMIAFIRGKDPMRLYDFMQQKSANTSRQAALQAQQQSVGYQSTGSQRAHQSEAGGVVDPIKQEVCNVLGISLADYDKWAKVS